MLCIGAFGRVYNGALTTEHSATNSEQKIYVKTVTGLINFKLTLLA